LEELGDLELSDDNDEPEEKIHAPPTPQVIAATVAAAAASPKAEVTNDVFRIFKKKIFTHTHFQKFQTLQIQLLSLISLNLD
jgi:hypothetical protein